MARASELIDDLKQALQDVAVPADAVWMRRYMRDRFSFLGVKSVARRAAARPTLGICRSAPVDELLGFAASCWLEPERELQYVAVDALVANAQRLDLEDLPAVVDLVVTKSWWDTADALGPRVIGVIVRNEPEGWREVDSWIDGDEMWLTRCSILQQLHYGEGTDAEVLFDRCSRRAEDPEFFIRKAIGWALRQYARVDPDAVTRFVDDNDDRLSPLSIREATKHLGSDS
jgi:3-methyladenine DNA glycosylase AlkD